MASKGGGRFSYFLAGLGMGTLVGLLFSPRSGQETRELLESKAEEGREYLKRRGEEAHTRTEEFVERGRKAVAREKENIRTAIDAGKEAYREASKT